MGFITLPRLSLDLYVVFSVENPGVPLRSPFLTFLTYYYFLHARLINPPPPRFYENIVIYTRRCRCVSRFAEFCAPSLPVSAPRGNTGAESFYLTFDSAAGEEKEANVHSHARQKGKDTGGRRNERKKREKRIGAGGACASTHRRVFSHGVAPRRQASSVARRAPSDLHVVLHRAARAHAVRVAAHSCLRQLT